MKLNIKNLKFSEKPSKKIEAFEQEITIKPLRNQTLLKLSAIPETSEDRMFRMLELTLMDCLDCSKEEANYLVENDLMSCQKLLEEVMNLTTEYNKQFQELAESKKKVQQKKQ